MTANESLHVSFDIIHDKLNSEVREFLICELGTLGFRVEEHSCSDFIWHPTMFLGFDKKFNELKQLITKILDGVDETNPWG
tara:strand:- start:11617 stop:11859 length:243 start_codon:yes stop_codon:yes gene_type:complete